MKVTPIQELLELGQSIWLDNINRAMIENGALKKMITQGLRGVTSNPSIFHAAISSTNEYDQRIAALFAQEKSIFEIYDELTVKDIQDAADIFLPVYKESAGCDGYISLEVNPQLAYRVRESVDEGIRLYQKVNRPNLMLKIPATDEGFSVTEELTAQGLNVNITLIFSLEQYQKAWQSYLKGSKQFLQSGGDARRVRSVASVFVSRLDSVVDKKLDALLQSAQNQQNRQLISALKGKAAVANSERIYAQYRKFLLSDEYTQLHHQGLQTQRVLWGSTSTKNPVYSDIKYVSELIGQDTINTIPEVTFNAFLGHGRAKEALKPDSSAHPEAMHQLMRLGIDLDAVCTQLLNDGVKTFEKAFAALLKSIEEKTALLCKR